VEGLKLRLSVLAGKFAVCRLEGDAVVPEWATVRGFVSVTRTADELSIVCAEGAAPDGTRCERGWRCLKVAGPLDLGMTGVVSALTRPLMEASVPVFVVSTFDTDYLLVRSKDVDGATAALRGAGHIVGWEPDGE
jgi:hypothetical protein